MEYLDLNKHDMEEFEEKIIECNACKYVIGPFIAMGAEGIVHKLINFQSGLSLHVVKIYRSIKIKPTSESLKDDPKGLAKLYSGCVVPDICYMYNYGGKLKIQMDLSNYRIDTKFETDDLFDIASDLVDKKKSDEAMEIYNNILQINKYHTYAMYNIAVLSIQKHNYNLAYNHLINAIGIEPNIVVFYTTLIKCLVSSCYLYQATSHYERMRLIFPYECSLDNMVLDIYLEIGVPEKANEYFSKAYLFTQSEYKKYENLILTDMTNKEAAYKIISSENKVQMFPDIKSLINAHCVYEKDVFININLGLSLMNICEYSNAKDLLLSQLYKSNLFLDEVCMVNIAFCEFYSGNRIQAVKMLNAYVEHLYHISEEKINLADVIGFTVFVVKINEQYSTIENPYKSLEIIDQIINSYFDYSSAPESIKVLYSCYKEAVEKKDNISKNKA